MVRPKGVNGDFTSKRVWGMIRETMEPIYEKSFQVRSYEVDLTGRVRATALLNYMQEAAGDHSRLLGVAVRDLMPLGLTWVLSRTHLRIFHTVHSRAGSEPPPVPARLPG